MISLCKLFLELANVHSEHPSGLVAPFGVIDSTKKSKIILSKLQDINILDPEKQKKRINQLRDGDKL